MPSLELFDSVRILDLWWRDLALVAVGAICVIGGVSFLNARMESERETSTQREDKR